ncbi:M24 family metallopeptidase [Natrialbaceae archaeon A-gly3]
MTDRRHHLEAAIRENLREREAGAFVAVGPGTAPSIRYCLADAPDHTVAIAFDGEEWLESTDTAPTHPAERLATRLSERDVPGPLLTPQNVPHDAALYLEAAGFVVASSDVLSRARAAKTAGELERVESAQAAATGGLERATAALADATAVNGSLEVDGEALTGERARRLIDEGVVAAGGFPAGNTVVDVGGRDGADPLPAGEPIVLATAPHGPDGYHGGLVRTVVVDGDGGRERRAHVAADSALKSAATMLRAGDQSVEAVEADLEAEVMAFGFEDGIEASVTGVGLEPRERPGRGDTITEGAVVRLEAAVTDVAGGDVRLADLVVVDEGARVLESPSRSLSL